MAAYYNDNDPFVCAWLRNLIAAGLIAPGDVDERSIVEVRSYDLKGYAQVHMFAGIGGWSYALRLAGWPEDRPVWTGSCPCQPFSAAGKRKAGADSRHLWPQWLRLIRECRPDVVFGEQVEAAIGMGWIDRVFADLEAEGFACGATVLGAHSAGAPHIRQRLWWTASSGGADGWLADAHGGLASDRDLQRGGQHGQRAQDGGAGRMGDACGPRLEERPSERQDDEPQRPAVERAGDAANFWSAYDLIPCLDGKARRAGPGIQPLAHGIPSRVGKLRAAGNAINPQVAAEFIKAVMGCAP